MKTQWTKEQQQVIDLRRRNILVSAAAGSGKTAVLVERILTMITEGNAPLDIDKLLVVTFTRAAAGEMKERLLKAIEERLGQEPENLHLQKQTTFIHNAQINTIDGFCAYVIKNYFHLIDLDPGYRTADEGELKLLKADVVKDVVEEAYDEKSAEFLTFVEWFATGKSDDGIDELILRLYDYACSHPWPKEWLQACVDTYQGEENSWQELLWEDVAVNLQEAYELAKVNLRLAEETDGPVMYLDALEEDAQLVEKLMEIRDYGEFAGHLGGFKFARLSTRKSDDVSPAKREQVKLQRAELKVIIKGLSEQYFFTDQETMERGLKQCAPVIGMLIELTHKFMERFAEKKRKKNLLDFSDMEHLALNILVRREDGKCIRTQAADELSEQFAEILIDEYQDSNYVQEMLLSSVSRQYKGENNVFMVGDVKQSIYRFRLACPDLFMDKYRTFTREESDSQRIDLHKNFRSRKEVLDTTNFVFYQVMHQSLGNVMYDTEAALYPGAVFPEGNEPAFAQTEILMLEKDNDMLKGEENGLNPQELEARMIGGRIREIVGTELVLDKGTNTYRKARYSDCVILLRTISGWADAFCRTLGQQDIPAYVTSKTGYFSAIEVVTVLNYLHVCDNPKQEIPFAAVLRSPIGGCTAKDLALIKNAFPKDKIYDGCNKYQESGEEVVLAEKLRRFARIYSEVRIRVTYTPIHELILYILKCTGYGDFVAAMPGGEQRIANLHMLVEKAMEFEKTSYRGLFHFIRYIENLQKYDVDYGEVNITGEQEDTVRIMSIHKSKGLEFPVVFVAGMGKKFNLMDINARTVLHPDHGIGTDWMDPVRRLKTPTLIKQVIRRQTLAENLGEEMRVLYVAMTRAKEKLILTGTIDRLENRVQSCCGLISRTAMFLPYNTLVKARDYWGWILPAMARSRVLVPLYERYGMTYDKMRTAVDEIPVSLRIVDPGELVVKEVAHQVERSINREFLEQIDSQQVYDETVQNMLKERFGFSYPFQSQRNVPVKVTVSELKKYFTPEEDGDDMFFESDIIPLIPCFIREQQQEMSGADRGTAYHRIMECLDFGQTATPEAIAVQMDEMEQQKKIDVPMRAAIEVKDIHQFMTSEIADRMKAANMRGELHKEQPFVISIPASEKDPGFADVDTILVQGIIDAFFYEDDEIVLVDYKTDRVRKDEEQILAEKYTRQLEYYAQALERTTGKRVKEKWIYSFTLKKTIAV